MATFTTLLKSIRDKVQTKIFSKLMIISSDMSKISKKSKKSAEEAMLRSINPGIGWMTNSMP